MSDNEFGNFLRSRREAVRPADVGLPAGPRRRTPGLRRSELAMLAGISVEYLTRLEQGRDRHPSAEVLGALVGALQLSPGDREQLWLILGHNKPTALCPAAAEPPVQQIRSGVRAVLDRLEPNPALVVNRIGDVLAHTTAYQQLAGPLGVLDGDPPNLPRFVLTDSRARAAHPDWEQLADVHVNQLKLGSHEQDPHSAQLVAELSAVGAEFTNRFRRPATPVVRHGTERWRHPEVGELRLDFEVMDLTEIDVQRLIVYVPHDEATSQALDRLNGRGPGALRAVRS
ncbi:helix-turn-helix transcriptional regulator [Saccharopolyspora sp. WRP15-2]|uniref:Helix-turn-helix transcriptional regulator n=1 Tax=Saccharopolyspora oryzae TaxID=2997343 RepID=A0ABT4USW4_9PSEU|nr:helix-turn-helix transcriptional regulator [Saccharopolyspora oryzae]MDA3624808.1 helix-turn-helix transcriptional regulator [Saccharopolyspora oryzae]